MTYLGDFIACGDLFHFLYEKFDYIKAELLLGTMELFEVLKYSVLPIGTALS